MIEERTFVTTSNLLKEWSWETIARRDERLGWPCMLENTRCTPCIYSARLDTGKTREIREKACFA
jgi:hypothetical protein